MLNFFVPHIFVAVSATVLLALLRGKFRVVAMLIWLLSVLPFVVAADLGRPTGRTDGVPLRVGTFNVMTDNRDFAGLEREVRAEALDIASFQEAGSSFWSGNLKTLADYPENSLRNVNSANTVILSRFPLNEVTMLPGTERPGRWPYLGRAVRVELLASGWDGTRAEPVVYFSVHPESPRSPELWRTRNAYLETVAEDIARLPPGTHVVVAGDFNTPTWSPFFRDFLRRTGLRDVAGSPWPAPSRFFRELGLPPALGTPIDHILVSPEIGVRDFRTGWQYGSDHLPVMATLFLPARDNGGKSGPP